MLLPGIWGEELIVQQLNAPHAGNKQHWRHKVTPLGCESHLPPRHCSHALLQGAAASCRGSHFVSISNETQFWNTQSELSQVKNVFPHLPRETRQEVLTRHGSEVSTAAEQLCNSQASPDILQINFLFYCEPGGWKRTLQKARCKHYLQLLED